MNKLHTITQNQVAQAYTNLQESDQTFANDPTHEHSQAIIHTQRTYYSLYSRYARDKHTKQVANIMRTRNLRTRAISNKDRMLKLLEQQDVGNMTRTELLAIIAEQSRRTLTAKTRAEYEYTLYKESLPATKRRAASKQRRSNETPDTPTRIKHPLTHRFVTTTKAQAQEWKDKYPDVYTH